MSLSNNNETINIVLQLQAIENHEMGGYVGCNHPHSIFDRVFVISDPENPRDDSRGEILNLKIWGGFNGAPEKVSNWTETLNVTQDGSQCVQGSDPVTGSEDCLFINVYTTDLSATNLSVMVFIYGGAFVSGNSTYKVVGPDYLLDEDIVFVSFNYRLGIFGFISTGDEVCSGNWGLKDQVLALKWVQSNIAYFGGDPNNVTLFGQSAGSASISYLLQTNKTKGLFSAAIMESGTSLNLWALNRRAVKTAFSVGTSLGIITTNSSTLIESLREVNYTELQTTSNTVATLSRNMMGRFFVNKSHELLSQGGFHKIPTIIGTNSNEAAVVGSVTAIIRLYFATYDIEVKNLAPIDLTSVTLDRILAALDIRFHYYGLLGTVALCTNQTLQFIDDDQFYRPIRQAVLQQSKYAPVYFYEFSYVGGLGGVENRNFSGVGHGEELGYLFRTYYTNVSETDELVRSRMVKMWTNFAKYSNPTPNAETILQNITWEIAGSNASSLNYLDVGTDLNLLQNPFEDAMEFYDGIYDEYGQPPYDTY
ncbi:hypothetical protein NQ318_010978 [Aromia moschata]|uniref:Carboxylic ester hydrolase n=1 Tax=Aromia moschata TaxID=1265417 RepID=A0AAV8YJT5_9CUCU|nr:hypothetical protein NQ318_010978 [Aromia moschata]